MFFHNYANYENGTYRYECPDCSFFVELQEDYVDEYPIAATEHAQRLILEHECV